MKKLLTPALALLALFVFTSLSVVQGLQKDQRKVVENTQTKMMAGTVTNVDEKAQTFTLMASGKQFTFSAKKAVPLPKKGEHVDVTYIQQTPGGPLEATSVKSSKSNSSEWVAQSPSTKMMTGMVTNTNEKAQTFTLKAAKGEEFTFSAKKASPLPKKDEQVEVTYIQQSPGGSLEATSVKSSKSNSSDRAASPVTTKTMTGKVLRVSPNDMTFTVMTTEHKEVVCSAKKLGRLPVVGKTYDIIYFPGEHPGDPVGASNLNLSKSNIN